MKCTVCIGNKKEHEGGLCISIIGDFYYLCLSVYKYVKRRLCGGGVFLIYHCQSVYTYVKEKIIGETNVFL